MTQTLPIRHREDCNVSRPDYAQHWPLNPDGTIDTTRPHPFGGCNCDFVKRLIALMEKTP